MVSVYLSTDAAWEEIVEAYVGPCSVTPYMAWGSRPSASTTSGKSIVASGFFDSAMVEARGFAVTMADARYWS